MTRSRSLAALALPLLAALAAPGAAQACAMYIPDDEEVRMVEAAILEDTTADGGTLEAAFAAIDAAALAAPAEAQAPVAPGAGIPTAAPTAAPAAPPVTEPLADAQTQS